MKARIFSILLATYTENMYEIVSLMQISHLRCFSTDFFAPIMKI